MTTSGLVGDRNASQMHVWRAEIVLLAAEGLGTNKIIRRTAKSMTCGWRWQERFMTEGFEGASARQDTSLTDRAAQADVAERVVAMTLTDPPGETTHWTGAIGTAYLARPRAAATPGSPVQALERIRSSSINYAIWLASMSTSRWCGHLSHP
jgi:hypothetical protein